MNEQEKIDAIVRAMHENESLLSDGYDNYILSNYDETMREIAGKILDAIEGK